jgi:hypothetical protein
MIFNTRARRLIITDPLHILKCIRYHFLSSPFRIGVGHGQTDFCIDDVRDKLPLPSIVFDNSRITKMHDLLALGLFLQASLHQNFNDYMSQAFLAFFPWFLLVAGLTNCKFSTKTRCGIFETAFWLLCFYRIILARYPHPPDTTERITPNKHASLYTTDPRRHALSTFYTLIVVLRNSSCPVCLNRLGSNPVEHLFGKARLKCRNVNMTKGFLSAIGLDLLTAEIDHLLGLIKAPKRRNVIGVDCEPWTPSSDLIFIITPIDIATNRTGYQEKPWEECEKCLRDAIIENLM